METLATKSAAADLRAALGSSSNVRDMHADVVQIFNTAGLGGHAALLAPDDLGWTPAHCAAVNVADPAAALTILAGVLSAAEFATMIAASNQGHQSAAQLAAHAFRAELRSSPGRVCD